MSFKWYFWYEYNHRCWYWVLTAKTGSVPRIKLTYRIPKLTEVVPRSQPNAPQRTVWKIHLDFQYHIFRCRSAILAVSKLCCHVASYDIYRQISNMRHKKSQTLNVLVSPCSCLCPVHYSQVLSRGWRCSWSSADRRCSNYIWVINNYIAY